MPRLPENSSALVSDLRQRLERLVAAAKKEGRDEALTQLRGVLAGGAEKGAVRGGRKAAPAKARAKSGKGRKNPWAGLSPEARLARINAIRKGRGLPAKTSL